MTDSKPLYFFRKEDFKVRREPLNLTIERPIRVGTLLGHRDDFGPEPLPNWWYLSFCDGDKPKGSQFLGACVVEGLDFASAVFESHRLKINPGGEVKGMECQDVRPIAEWRNRLVTSKEELDNMPTEANV